MNIEPELVDLPKLREVVAGLNLNDAKTKEYIDARWLKYVEWWDSRARWAKNRYLALRSAVVIWGAAIPVLVALRELQQRADKTSAS